MRPRFWAAALLVAFAAQTACSDSGGAMPSPTPAPPNVAGTWEGTVSFTAGGVAAQELFQMKLTQASGTTAVTGSYTARRFSGSLTGEITDATFNGTFEYNSNAQGQICLGTFAVSGPARGNTLTWTSPNVVGSSCTNTPVGLVMTVQRQ